VTDAEASISMSVVIGAQALHLQSLTVTLDGLTRPLPRKTERHR
jgi:hypothetical protein